MTTSVVVFSCSVCALIVKVHGEATEETRCSDSPNVKLQPGFGESHTRLEA